MNCFIIAALTTDGFIGRSADDRSFNWTSAEDKQFYVEKIKSADAIVMGAKTFETFKKHPKNSRWEIYTRSPQNFVNQKPEIITARGTNEEPSVLVERLRNEGLQNIAIAGGASIYTMFLKTGLVNQIFLTVEPVFFGQGVKLFTESVDIKMRLNSVKNLSDQTLLLEFSL